MAAKNSKSFYRYRRARDFYPGAPEYAFERAFPNMQLMLAGTGYLAGGIALTAPVSVMNPLQSSRGMGGQVAGGLFTYPLLDNELNPIS